jgi:hypothetical protein
MLPALTTQIKHRCVALFGGMIMGQQFARPISTLLMIYELLRTVC